jgi:hypothetical protein
VLLALLINHSRVVFHALDVIMDSFMTRFLNLVNVLHPNLILMEFHALNATCLNSGILQLLDVNNVQILQFLILFQVDALPVQLIDQLL